LLLRVYANGPTMTATAMAKSVYNGGFIEELRPCTSPPYERRRRRFFLTGTVMAAAVFRLAVPVAMPRAAPAQAFAALRNTLSMGFFLSHGLFMLRSFGCGPSLNAPGAPAVAKVRSALASACLVGCGWPAVQCRAE
jgi:hypothetical protein